MYIPRRIILLTFERYSSDL